MSPALNASTIVRGRSCGPSRYYSRRPALYRANSLASATTEVDIAFHAIEMLVTDISEATGRASTNRCQA